jgi:hypothetical protein
MHSGQIPRCCPTTSAATTRGWRYLPGCLHYETPWELIADNLLDFSHLSYVHAATLLMHSGARPAGAAQDDESVGVRFHSCQALTPETAESTHNFFQESHRAEHGGPDTTQRICDGLLAAFLEDRQMIGAQWHNMALPTDRPMLPLAMDAALKMFRRKLQAAVDSEASAAVAASTP